MLWDFEGLAHAHKHTILPSERPVGDCVDVLCTCNLYVSFPKEPYKRDDVLQKSAAAYAQGVHQAPCHTFEWVLLNIRISGHTNERVTFSYRDLSHVLFQRPCHTYEWVLLNIRISGLTNERVTLNVSQMKESRSLSENVLFQRTYIYKHTYICTLNVHMSMPRMWMSHVKHMNEVWFICTYTTG